MNSNKAYALSEALSIAYIDYESGEHDGLVDAKNTAKLFIKMERETVLTLNPYLFSQPKVPANCPFAKPLAGYKTA